MMTKVVEKLTKEEAEECLHEVIPKLVKVSWTFLYICLFLFVIVCFSLLVSLFLSLFPKLFLFLKLFLFFKLFLFLSGLARLGGREDDRGLAIVVQ